MNPHIIVDAWNFDGFISVCDGDTKHGLVGEHLRVKEKGWLHIDTSWGLQKYGPGDHVVTLDIAACVAEGGDPIQKIILKFLHEFCHWAEGVHRPGKAHGPIWDDFLAFYILEDNVNGR